MKDDATPTQRLMELFPGNERKHGTHGEPDPRGDNGKYSIGGTARTLDGPATEELWHQHVEGRWPLGVIPIRDDGTCYWGSIDYDVYDVNLLEVVEKVEQAKLPLVPCVSKSGGLHLFLFLEGPESAGEVKSALRDAAASLGMAECEIFPKQATLEPGANGNWMVMPYFGDTFGGRLRLQRGLKRTGAEMTITEFLSQASKRRTTVAALAALCAGASKRAKTKPKRGGDFGDGPSCLQRMAQEGFPSDGRKRALFMMAVYFKRSDSSDWRERLEQANRKFFQQPLSSEEVLTVTKSVAKKDYEYTCKEEPMRSVCNSGLCRTRLYGVGDGSAAGVPVIVSWRKISSDNPVWYVTIEGSNQQLEIRRIDDITNYRRFADQCAKQLNRFFRPVKTADWADALAKAAPSMIEEAAEEETTREGTFRELLQEFLTSGWRTRTREDVLTGRPWEDEEKARYVFRMQDLHRFVADKHHMRDATRHEMSGWIKNLGGGRVSKTPTTIDGRGVRLWFMPFSSAQAELALVPGANDAAA